MTDKVEDGIFSGASPEVVNNNLAPTPAPTDQYSDLVGEGKKYATIDAAMASVAPAQYHISKLEGELAEMRQELELRKTVEETLDRIVSNKEEGSRPAPSSLNEETVEQIVAKTLTQRETQTSLTNNIATVETRMVKEFGEKASEKVATKAAELGVSIDFMMGLAGKSPAAFLNQFGLNSKTSEVPVAQSSTVRTDNFQQSPPEKPKSVMRGATSKDMVNAWKAAAPTGNS